MNKPNRNVIDMGALPDDEAAANADWIKVAARRRLGLADDATPEEVEAAQQVAYRRMMAATDEPR